MKKLARVHVQLVLKQQRDRPSHRRTVLQAPAQRSAFFPLTFEVLESRDRARGQGCQRPGANRVDANLVAAEVTSEISSHRLERGLRYPHPVVFRPRTR